ncbi:MAG TPA: sirohydrochlorin chelatase, partial [Pirellulales bacterium]|nr:sirohydrochlorin chelatase [Pirellulales bacterium]
MDRHIVLVVGHGSREVAANDEFEQLVARYQARRPELELRHGYIELARPALAEALDSLPPAAAGVTLLPLFLFAAGHVKNDIPLAMARARRDRPDIDFRAARALGVHPGLVELLLQRAAEAMSIDAENARRTVVVVVGRGSSDPDANGDFCKVVRLLAESRPFRWVLPAFVGITGPRFAETLELAARCRPERLLVLPYFLFGGRLLQQIGEQMAAFATRYSWIQTAVAGGLGIHDHLLTVMDERVAGAATERAPLPCDNCQYRTPLPGRAEQVGGL